MVGVLIASVAAIRRGHIFGYVPLVIVPLGIFIRLGYQYEWTGFGETSRSKDDKLEVKPRKTLWDWMSLLLVPAMIAILTAGLAWWQTSSEQAQKAQEAALKRQQAARQQSLEAQNTAIQLYLGQMSALLLEDNLRNAAPYSEVRLLAQARTTSVLQAVEPENQRIILQFISEANLVQKNGAQQPIISLDHTDLSASDLRYLDLRGADLSFANLSEANLSFANLGDANLTSANLSDAALFRANLSGADLKIADLSGADLRDAILSGANLNSATGITNEELEQQASSLEGATMPNGQKYEEWLKSRGEGD
jgi:uncharacterized protein YjbI with pentapeptide repeats